MLFPRPLLRRHFVEGGVPFTATSSFLVTSSGISPLLGRHFSPLAFGGLPTPFLLALIS